MDGTENEHPSIEAQVSAPPHSSPHCCCCLCCVGRGGAAAGCLLPSPASTAPTARRLARVYSPFPPPPQGFPTLMFFPAEEGAEPVPYDGGRTLGEMTK